jgi:excisionase family DNA binding protein
MSSSRQDRRQPEWLSLGVASRLLGVAPGTLRRWTDSGRVQAFTTPGGHRRYRRSTLAQLVRDDQRATATPSRSVLTPARLARVYRARARSAQVVLPWLAAIDDEHREWFRAHGRRLAHHLLDHLDAGDRIQARHHLAEAEAEAAAYGRVAARLGASLSGAVEGFLHFRRPFLHELALAAARQALGVAQTTRLVEAADEAMDRLLMAAMTAHSLELVTLRRDAPALGSRDEPSG